MNIEESKTTLLLESADGIHEQIRTISQILHGSADNHPWEIGEKYLVRTVTNYLTGRLSFVGPQELVFEDASWIADTGRFSTALQTGELKEVEPVGRQIVGRGSIVDAQKWIFDLPREQK